MVFKILTLNIHKGFSAGNRKETLAKIKENIRSTHADVVCLQEVVGAREPAVNQKPKAPQFEYLADQIWSHFAYGKNAVSSQGHHGNAILSHFPIVDYENIDISNHRLERRGVLHAVIELPPNKAGSKSGAKSRKARRHLHVLTLHLDLSGWGRARQLKKINKIISERVPENDPLIVCGDFNDWREKATASLAKVGMIEAHAAVTGGHARTFPAQMPVLKLDRIYVRGLEIQGVHRLAHGPWKKLSDHIALAAELGYATSSTSLVGDKRKRG